MCGLNFRVRVCWWLFVGMAGRGVGLLWGLYVVIVAYVGVAFVG